MSIMDGKVPVFVSRSFCVAIAAFVGVQATYVTILVFEYDHAHVALRPPLAIEGSP